MNKLLTAGSPPVTNVPVYGLTGYTCLLAHWLLISLIKKFSPNF